MTCFFCKGDMTDSTTTFTATLENTIVIIKNVLAINAGSAAR